MKKFIFFGLVALGLLLASCNNEEIPQNPDLNGGTGQLNTYLQLSITSPANTTTKTTGPVSDVDADGSKINSVHVYLVNNGQIEYSIEKQIASNESFTTEKFQAPTGTFKLFVVANPDNTKTPLRSTGSIQLVIDNVTEALAMGGYPNGNFLMATACDVTNITQAGASVTIAPSNTVDAPATATAQVDRVAVKVNNQTTGSANLNGGITSITDAGSSTPFFNEVKVTGFVLVNGNEKFNLIQKWEAMSGDVTGTVANTPFGTKGATYMNGYYNPIQNYGLVTMDAQNNVTAIEDLTFGKTDEVFKNNPVFTTENRPPFVLNQNLTAGMAQTTGVIYHTVVNDGQTFYYIGGKVYKDLAALKSLDAFKNENWTEDTPASDIRVKGVKVYEDGNMYYSYFIQDQNYKVTYKGEISPIKYYNVLRNSVYNLTINSIKNIGDDIPGGGEITPANPNPPIDPDDTYLDVTVQINPWVLNNIGIEF